MTEEKLKDMLKRCEKQFRMPTLFSRFIEPPQRPWVGLTNEELDLIWLDCHGDCCLADGRILNYERALEAKLKEKNA